MPIESSRDAVIVATARSPIGRAVKGSLRDVRPDDLAATIVQAALDKVPELDPHRRSTTSTSAAGCPAASRASTWPAWSPPCSGLDDLPGATRHPLLRVVAADHPDGVARDPGRRGRRLRLGRRRDASPGTPGATPTACRPRRRRWSAAAGRTRASPRPGSGPRPAPQGGRRGVDRPARRRRAARHLPGDGADRGEPGPGLRRHPRGHGRVRRTQSRTSPRRPSPTASGPARSPRSPPPDGTVVGTDDGPRAGVTLEAVAGLKPVFRPDGRITAGNCCPLNDGAAAVVVMSAQRARRAGHHPAGPDRLHRRHRPVPGDHGPRPGRGVPAGAARGPA